MAASQVRKRVALQACLLPTERTPEVPAAEAVDVAAGVSDWMVNEVADTIVGVTDCIIIDPVVLMECSSPDLVEWVVGAVRVTGSTLLAVRPIGAASVLKGELKIETKLVKVGPTDASTMVDATVGLRATVSGPALSAIVNVVVDAGVINRPEGA